jgi:hypothetical protein
MAEKAKTPQRTPEEITADIATEREALVSAFDALSGEVQQAADAGAEKARSVGRKALVVVPAVAAGVGALVAAAALARRGRRRDS